jgi:hypothetical protein
MLCFDFMQNNEIEQILDPKTGRERNTWNHAWKGCRWSMCKDTSHSYSLHSVLGHLSYKRGRLISARMSYHFPERSVAIKVATQSVSMNSTYKRHAHINKFQNVGAFGEIQTVPAMRGLFCSQRPAPFFGTRERGSKSTVEKIM